MKVDDKELERAHTPLENESLNLRDLLLRVRAADGEEQAPELADATTTPVGGDPVDIEAKKEVDPSQEDSSIDEALLLDSEAELTLDD